jgi:hypothetical protein
MIVRYAIVLSLSFSACAQTQSTTDDNAEDSVFAHIDAEFMFDNAEDDDAEQERLRWLMENPFDLNRVSREELQTIPGVLPADANAVLLIRRQIRRFASVYQLTAIDTLQGLVDKLVPYVTVPEARSDGKARCDIRTRMITRYGGSREGEPEYLGSPFSWYNRMSFEMRDDIAGGVLFEKDAGERPSDGFVSGFIQARRVAGLVDLTLGDFTPESGQGLVLWGGSGYAKGSAATGSVWRSGTGIRPYRSKDEFHFMRGIAASTAVSSRPGEFRLSLFYSWRSLSGRENSSGEITSLYEAGLFRTESERKLANTLQERVVGGRVELRSWKGWSVGVTGYHAHFSHPLVAGRNFEFEGMSSSAASLDILLGFGRCTIFGEAAYSGAGAFATLIGMVVHSPKVRVTLMMRDYGVRFHSLHANGFGENGATRNERGVYVNFRIMPARFLTVSAYMDLFTFPWRTFGNPLPSSGLESYLQTDFRFSRQSTLSLRYTRKQTEQVVLVNDNVGRLASRVADQKRERGRITVETPALSWVRLRSRAEMVHVSFGSTRSPERGVLLYQDIALTISRWARVHYRLVFFETASYESRVYEYENDVRGGYANPAMFGRGKRWYILAVFHPAGLFNISARYAVTDKDERNRVAPEQSLSVQIDLRF